MHYYTHNIGQFAAVTRFLSPEEIGIYVILKDEYFANGMRIACDRIANMMPPECEESLHRVLHRFFRVEDGFYVCDDFDKELADYKDRGAINSENAKKRWEKKRMASESKAKSCKSHASRIESDAKSCLTNNQEPITNNQELSNCVTDIPKAKRKKRTRLEVTELPDEWRAYCESKDPELDPDKVFADFYDYWTGKASDPLATDWTRVWQSEVRKVSSGPDWMRTPKLKASCAKKSGGATHTAFCPSADYYGDESF